MISELLLGNGTPKLRKNPELEGDRQAKKTIAMAKILFTCILNIKKSISSIEFKIIIFFKLTPYQNI